MDNIKEFSGVDDVDLYEELVSTKLFSGSREEWENLPSSSVIKLLNSYQMRLSDYDYYKTNGFFEGTIEEYSSLDAKQQLPLFIKKSEAQKKDLLNDLEDFYRTLKTCSESMYKMLLENNAINYYRNRVKSNEYLSTSFMEVLASTGVEIPKGFDQLVDTSIEKPKFGVLDKKKYKVLNELITDDYIFRLKTRQIDSVFETEQDYNDKKKWMEYIDKKESEYNELRAKGYYNGVFEEYLQEDVATTIGLTRFYKDEKITVPVTQTPEDSVHSVQAQADSELHRIMNGKANQNLVASASQTISQIIGESKRKPDSKDLEAAAALKDKIERNKKNNEDGYNELLAMFDTSSKGSEKPGVSLRGENVTKLSGNYRLSSMSGIKDPFFSKEEDPNQFGGAKK